MPRTLFASLLPDEAAELWYAEKLVPSDVTAHFSAGQVDDAHRSHKW